MARAIRANVDSTAKGQYFLSSKLEVRGTVCLESIDDHSARHILIHGPGVQKLACLYRKCVGVRACVRVCTEIQMNIGDDCVLQASTGADLVIEVRIPVQKPCLCCYWGFLIRIGLLAKGNINLAVCETRQTSW